ncbi:MAG: hypothetical protein J6I86_01260 [Bacteroidaceae bacterium]|nr:hypothetical protein [Bacteroidaceae bacterium]
MKRYAWIAFCMLMSALSATADSEIFYTCSWNEAEKQVQFTTQTEDCQVIEGSHPDDWITLGGGYFVVRGQSEYKVLNIVGGEVHLVIPYGAKITTKHVKLEKGRTLHIHSTAKDDGGLEQLVVKNDAYKNAAGIGSAKGVDAGDLYIHGGYIKTTGYEYGAGIGGENGSVRRNRFGGGRARLLQSHMADRLSRCIVQIQSQRLHHWRKILYRQGATPLVQVGLPQHMECDGSACGQHKSHRLRRHLYNFPSE